MEAIDLSWDSIGGEGPATPTVATAEPATPEVISAVVTPANPDPAAPVTPEAAPANPEAPAGEKPPESPDDADDVAPLTTPEGKKPQYRFRPGDQTEVLALEMVRSAQKTGQTLSLKDALAKAESILKPEGAAPSNPAADEMQSIDSELETVRETLDDAAQNESLYTLEVRKAQQRELELTAKRTRLEDQQARAAAASAQTESQKFDAAESESWKETHRLFPSIKDQATPIAKAMEAEWNAIAANPKHPLHNDPDLPFTLAAKHAAKLGIAPATTAQVVPPVQTPAAPASGLQPAPASGGKSTVPIAVTPAQKEAQFVQTLAKATDQEIGKLLEDDIFGGPQDQGYAFR